MTRRQGDQGFTLIELLLVIVVLGILATVVVASVGGVTSEAQESSCKTDAHVLYVAGEAYFAQRATNSIASTESGPDAYELALVSAGFLHGPSKYYDLDSSGALTPAANSPCQP
jgi:general secretion pathway protein G